jgi:xanthine dehydrogenase YagR molybdenum-binding subunit
MRLAVLDLPEGNAMRAPGEAPGLMALEIAMDEMAEKLGMDPVAVPHPPDQRHPGRGPEKPERPFSQRQLVECLRTGRERFGWSKRKRASPAGARRPLAGRHGRGRRLPQQPVMKSARACGWTRAAW